MYMHGEVVDVPGKQTTVFMANMNSGLLSLFLILVRMKEHCTCSNQTACSIVVCCRQRSGRSPANTNTFPFLCFQLVNASNQKASHSTSYIIFFVVHPTQFERDFDLEWLRMGDATFDINFTIKKPTTRSKWMLLIIFILTRWDRRHVD